MRPPKPGDFVKCLFPFDENPESPAPVPHIAYLVGFKGKDAVLAIYTTTTLTENGMQKSPYAVKVPEGESQSMGMQKPFMIDGSRLAFLPIAPEFFPGADNGKLPVIGSATDSLKRAVEMRAKSAMLSGHSRTLGPKALRRRYGIAPTS